MAHLKNILHAVGIPFSALTSVIFGLMIVSFPLGAYAIFNSNIGDDIDYSFPLEKFDIFIAGVNIQLPMEYEIGDVFVIFWAIFIILFVITFLGPKKNFIKNLFTNNIPDPDLLIRTGDTKRLSNFLLWQLAYSEIFFEKKLWPEFNKTDYIKIIKKFKKIKRNFGKI